MASPKAFVSYSWSSPDHEQWVIALATQLRENGVDVILDKWDLKEGHDAIAFMEKMVTDPDIKKVIVVLDKTYADKADGRKGGVGTETQIVSAEVYKKADQNKFVGVISERNELGQPYLPAYYKSRIYIDLSDPDSYGSNFDRLLRWIFDKPLHVKPTIGQEPEFLKENAISLGTGSRARRAIDLTRTGGHGAEGALDDYLQTFSEGLEQFRIVASKKETFDDEVLVNIEAFLPHRNEFIEVIGTLVRFWPFDATHNIQKFLERVAVYMYRPENVNQWTDWDFDNFKFFAHELFLYTITLLIRGERFSSVASLLNAGYYLGDAAEDRRQPIEDFLIFRNHLRSLEYHNQKSQSRRHSLHADLLEKRSHSSGVPFRLIMQSDFVLYLRSSVDAVKNQTQQWWPETLVYATFRQRGPFELFARAQSQAYFSKISPMLGVQLVGDLRDTVSKLGAGPNQRPYIPRWQFDSINPSELANIAKLGTKP